MVNSIFSFLKDEFPDVYSKCEEMETNILSKTYASALGTARVISEILSRKICQLNGNKPLLKFSPHERLKEMKYAGYLNRELLNKYFEIKNLGNKSLHGVDAEYTFNQVKRIHKLVYEITKEFYETFSKSHLNDIPSYSFDIESEIEFRGRIESIIDDLISNNNVSPDDLEDIFNLNNFSNEEVNEFSVDFKENIVYLFESMQYLHISGPDIERDYHVPFYEDQLRDSLNRVNGNLSNEIVDSLVNILKDNNLGSVEETNLVFMSYLQNGVDVSYVEGDVERTEHVSLVDFENIDINTFQIATDWTVKDSVERRFDIVIFLNGLPLVVVELNSLRRDEDEGSEAYLQLHKDISEVKSMFTFNAFCVLCDSIMSKAGTITSSEDRFMEWKSVDGNMEDSQFWDSMVLFKGMFIKSHFLDIIKNFLLYSLDSTNYNKILGAYHQYFAVNNALDKTLDAINGDGRAGVFWHTQGSGKSLSMVFYVNKLQHILDNPTFVVLTDRNDLDNQLYSQFSKCSNFIRQSPIQAKSRENLKELLNNRSAGGVLFTTLQKFEDTDDALTSRNDIIVITDEAHRSQYGLEEKVNVDTGERSVGSALKVRNNLPNATFIGFTGTPISSKDKDTREVFGDYIDIYDMTQSVEDGATCEIEYEDRVLKLEVDNSVLDKIDDLYDSLAVEGDVNLVEKSKKYLSKLETLLGSKDAISDFCTDLISHYENNRMFEFKGKAMIVAYSRNIAMNIYKEILNQRPDWESKVKVVMTGSSKDPEEWSEIVGDKNYRTNLANKFKNPDDEFKIAIVVDMWLTGFDVPELDTMYIYKPMKGHNLMQAIARVNRVCKGKSGGLIVDYVGIKDELKEAMSDYTVRDRDNYEDMDVRDKSYPRFREILGICKALLYNLDYSDFNSQNPEVRSKTINKGVDFLLKLENEQIKEEFLSQSLSLKKELSLCRSIVTDSERLDATYFDSLRVVLTRMQRPQKLNLDEINSQINILLENGIKSKGVVTLISDSQIETLTSDELIDNISNIEEKDLAVNLAKKVLDDKINGEGYNKNIVKSRKFSDMLKKIMDNYINKRCSVNETLVKLTDLSKCISDDVKNGANLDLNPQEQAFYDAICEPGDIKSLYENDKLIEIARELTYEINQNKTIDWDKKESSYAGMKRAIKRLLKKYDYPQEDLSEIMGDLLNQSKHWTSDSEVI